MYILIFANKKWMRLAVFSLITITLITAYLLVADYLFPQLEIILDQRISFVFPHSTELASIYMSPMYVPMVETSVRFGNQWKTETIQQHEMPEISFQYPEVLRMEDEINLGQEIRIHMNYRHTNNKVHGFFQVWKLERPLKEFLEESKKYSSMVFLSFKESSVKTDHLNGFMWDYVFASKSKDIVGLEVFIENGKEMYRFSMFIPKENYKPSYKKIFVKMYQSLRINEAAVSSDILYVDRVPVTTNIQPAAIFTQFLPLRFAA